MIKVRYSGYGHHFIYIMVSKIKSVTSGRGSDRGYGVITYDDGTTQETYESAEEVVNLITKYKDQNDRS